MFAVDRVIIADPWDKYMHTQVIFYALYAEGTENGT